MPKDLHRRIQRDAERRGVTLNAEILLLLDRAFELRGFVDAISSKIQTALQEAVLLGVPIHGVVREIEDEAKKDKPDGEKP
jgi:hypothetical protein